MGIMQNITPQLHIDHSSNFDNIPVNCDGSWNMNETRTSRFELLNFRRFQLLIMFMVMIIYKMIKIAVLVVSMIVMESP